MNKVIQSFIHLCICVALISCARGGYVAKPVALQNEVVNASMGQDSLIEAMIKPYRNPIEASMKEELIDCAAPAVKGLPESSMGNLVADLLRDGSSRISNHKIDIAFLNTGGLRVEWPQGKITRAMVFELMPFENMVEYIEMNGVSIQLLMDQVAARGGAPVSGISFDISKGKAKNVKVDGVYLNPNQHYTLVSTDYLLNNGDKYEIPPYLERFLMNIKFRDLLFEELDFMNKQGKILHPKTDGRVRTVVAP